tara:strand:+ start:209 stop:1177 length:969 start_codon:yes stop_codon:yes gene_type:complete
MTSKIVVNNIEADAGVSTVTFNSNVERGSSNLHSTGLNVNDTFVHSTGIALGAGSTIGAVTGVTTYYGDGSQLTGAGPTLTNGANNRIITATGANALNAEESFTFDSGVADITGKLRIDVDSTSGAGSGNVEGIFLRNTNETDGNAVAIFAGADDYAAAASAINFINIDHSANTGAITFDTRKTGNVYAEKMRISSEGYVTKPQTPAFHVSRQGGDVSANNYVTFDHVDYNNGSHYNNSDGKFTAPVTGIYFFSAWTFTGSTNAFYLRINGTTFGEYTWDDTGGCGTWVCPMTVNQYAQIYSKYTWRGTSDYHNAFCGYLIG